MKKTGLLFIVLAMSANFVIAQGLSATQDLRRDKDGELDLSDFRGSKYLEDNFKKGQVKDELTNEVIELYLKYDVYSDVFERKPKLTTQAHTYLKKMYGVDVIYDGRTFVLENFFTPEGNMVLGYLEKLGEARGTAIFLDYEKSLEMPQRAENSLTKDKVGRINSSDRYVIKDANGIAVSKLNKKNAHSFFPKEIQSQIKKYVKTERLKFRDTGDVMLLIEFINGL